MADLYSSSWSEVASDNDASYPDGWQGGTTFPHIPPIGREMMAAIKREWNLSHPTLTTGGNGDTVTLTPATAITEYATGQIFAAKLNADLGAIGTTTRTLNVSGKGAKKIYLQTFAGGVIQPIERDARTGQTVFFYYDATLDSGAGGFVVFSLIPAHCPPESIACKITSENGVVASSGTSQFTFRVPYQFWFTGAKASLNTAQTSGSILTIQATYYLSGIPVALFQSPYLTIDNGETTSVTAATPVQIVTGAAGGPLGFFPVDVMVEVRVSQIGDGTARGLKVTLLGFQK